MYIVFGLHLDGLKPKMPRTAAGSVTVGPKGMLDVLETQLGLSAATPHPSEAPLSYLQFLREASSPDRFFHRSLQIDPVNVARTLLDWREQWYEAGWDGTFPNDVPARLADMAAVERVAKGRGPLTHGERVQQVAEALAVRETQIQRVELHTPLDNFPYAWQRVLDALPWVPADGLEPTPAGPLGSDLELVQTKLLAIANRNVDRPSHAEPLQGDRSVIVVKAVSRDISADAIAEFLLTSGQMEGTLLVAEHGGIILDNALERVGLPRCGFQWHSRFRTATQVLKLALALVWEPVDPRRILQYRECQKVWGNQAAHASVAGVLPGPRFWGDIVDACELLVDHRVDNPLYDPGRGTRLPQRCRLAVCGSCGHISARIRHCPTLFGTPLR